MSVIEADTMLGVGMLLAFGAGALSFLSPCVLPIFPAYLSYITGVSVKDLQTERNRTIRRRLLSHSGLLIQRLTGIFMIIMGLFVQSFNFAIMDEKEAAHVVGATPRGIKVRQANICTNLKGSTLNSVSDFHQHYLV